MSTIINNLRYVNRNTTVKHLTELLTETSDLLQQATKIIDRSIEEKSKKKS